MKITNVATVASLGTKTFTFAIGKGCKINRVIFEHSGRLEDDGESLSFMAMLTSTASIETCVYFERVTMKGAILAGLTIMSNRLVADLYHDEVYTQGDNFYCYFSNSSGVIISCKVTVLFEKPKNRK